MAKRTRNEIMEMVGKLLGDRDDDEALSMIEDFGDSYPDDEDWRKKYEENDRQWRDRYRKRFFEGGKKDSPSEQGSDMDDPAPDQETDVLVTYDQLFKEEE